MDTPAIQEIKAILRAHGLSPSAPRVAIYTWLRAHEVHPTVDAIYQAPRPEIATLSRTTVYNVLHAFVEKGLAKAVRTEDLELRYDGNTTNHAHFKCTRCGALADLGMIPPSLPKSVKLPAGCKPETTAVTFWGLCAQCAEQKA